jgi:hypothetical protein
MLDNLEHNQSNGNDGPTTPTMPHPGLGNTNPVATLGSTLGAGAPVTIVYGRPGVGKTAIVERALERLSSPAFVVQGADIGADFYVRSDQGYLVFEMKQVDERRPVKPSGQVVLFKKVIEDWDFSEREAATLLGFESSSDLKDIFLGLKPVGHRDANDRLRAVLRIAADLDALFQDVASVRDWLDEPQTDLGGRTPRALLDEGSMENLLQVKYYLSHLSGR